MRSIVYGGISQLRPETLVEVFPEFARGLTHSLSHMKPRPDGTPRDSESPLLSTDVFAEPGARNERGEYHRWLYIKFMEPENRSQKQQSASMMYPWPFATNRIDAELLLAHYHMTKFINWPRPWNDFKNDVGYCAHYSVDSLFWALAGFTNATVPTALFDRIPQEVIHALTRSDEARG